MNYLCLIYDDERIFQTMPKAELDAFMGEYRSFSESIRRSGHFVAGSQLQPISAATTLRRRNGQLSTTDGPFAETKEQLGGYYLIEARDLTEALQIAARIPSTRTGSVEVRPLI
jgi:hypothetical protein